MMGLNVRLIVSNSRQRVNHDSNSFVQQSVNQILICSSQDIVLHTRSSF